MLCQLAGLAVKVRGMGDVCMHLALQGRVTFPGGFFTLVDSAHLSVSDLGHLL